MKKAFGAIALGIVVFIPLALVIAGQLDFLRGQEPSDLGTRSGGLKAPDAAKENSVSSQAAIHPHGDYHVIAPLAYNGDGKAAFAKLAAIVRAMDGAKTVTQEPVYLYAQFQSKWLHFVDDAEFLLDENAGVIHMRSASRLGRRDFGVNRKRLESIREKFGQSLLGS